MAPPAHAGLIKLKMLMIIYLISKILFRNATAIGNAHI